jgi:all-trans-retinol 13,14-reductase
MTLDTYDTVIIGNPPSRYHIVAGEKELKKELIKQFPDEEEAIKKYYKMVKKTTARLKYAALLKSFPLPLSRVMLWTGLYRLMARGYTKTAKTSVQNVLEKLTANKDLQALLAYNFADYGTEPSKAPFFLQAMVAAHYMNGAYYPHGGPKIIPNKVIQTIVDKGGKVLVSATVDRILVDELTGKATGVQMKDGHIIESNVVVSDAGFMNTVTRLLPAGLINVDFAAEDSPDLLHPGTSGLYLFVGLNGNAESLNLPKSNIYIHSSNDLSATAERIKRLTLDEALELDPKDVGVIFVGCPSTKDSSWGARHPDKSTLEIITQAPYHWFEKFEQTFDKATKSHGPEYDYAKKRIAEKVWSRVVQALDSAKLPKTLDAVDHYEVGSPISFAHYYKSQRGALYGLDHDLKRFEPKTFFLRLRPDLPEVPGLYLTGQDIIADSMMGAMIGGLLCAQKVLGVRNPMSLLRNDVNNKEKTR